MTFTPKLAGVDLTIMVSAVIMMASVPVMKARTMVYISNADSREIYVLELNQKDGTSKVVDRVAVTGTVMPLAISPDRKYLCAGMRSEPYAVSSFAIDPNSGRLSFLKTVPLADNMAYLSIDHKGRYLFGASYSGNKISVNVINSGGEIHPEPLEVIPTGKHAHAIVTDPSNMFLFVPNLGEDVVLQYRFDGASGKITPNQPSAVQTKKGAGPRHIVFHPNGRFLFSTNELDGTVSTYSLHVSGTLALLNSASVIPADFQGNAPATADLHLTPDGRFLYASERTSSTIAAFQVNRDSGQLTLMGNYATETQPRGFNIDPEGRYLLAVGQKSHGMTTYEIDQKTGALRKLSHLDLGDNPNWVEIISLP